MKEFSPLASAPRRVEGRDKVTGRAQYTADLSPADLRRAQVGPEMLHATVVQSTMALGTVAAIETAVALAAPGVRTIVTHENAARLKRVKTLMSTELDSYLPLQSSELRYHGQPLAVVVADSLEHARYAASLVRVRYAPGASAGATSFAEAVPRSRKTKKVGAGEPAIVKWGKPQREFDAAEVQLDCTYTTAPAHHNAMEPGAAIATWEFADGKQKPRLLVWNTTQFAYGDAIALATMFGYGGRDSLLRIVSQVTIGLELDGRIRVIAPLIGGGFGSKGANQHMVLAVLAAHACREPVKLVLPRPQTYALMPYRAATHQRVRLGAESPGRLTSILHNAVAQHSNTASFAEPIGEMTPHLYACDHVEVVTRVAPLDTNAPGWMRAPGVAPGLFALESAMDELAHSLRIDPIELRLLNHADVDPHSGHEWSSKSLKECYRAAAERIAWSSRVAQPASTREGEFQVGYGMASAAHLTLQFPAVARIILRDDGCAVVQTATQEIGQGAVTALTQIAAEALGLPIGSVRLEFGDTKLPIGGLTAGSSTTLSVGSAIQAAAKKVSRRLIRLATADESSPLHGAEESDILLADGFLQRKSDPARRDTFEAVLTRGHITKLEEKAVTGRSFGKSRYARCAFGAQFAKVAVHSLTGEIRVRRLVGAFAAGRIVNPVMARSQFIGGMIWGIGHALFEETMMDETSGKWVTSNLADTLVPTQADVSGVEALFVEEDDRLGSTLGVKGIGEIGITGVAAAIANAVFNATGKRLRDLPLTPDKVILP